MRTDVRACVADGQDSIAHLTSHDKHVAVGRASRPARATTAPRRGKWHWPSFPSRGYNYRTAPPRFSGQNYCKSHTPATVRPPTSNFSRAQTAQLFSSIRAVGRGKSATQQARVVAGEEGGGRWLAAWRSEGEKGPPASGYRKATADDER